MNNLKNCIGNDSCMKPNFRAYNADLNEYENNRVITAAQISQTQFDMSRNTNIEIIYNNYFVSLITNYIIYYFFRQMCYLLVFDFLF